MIADVANLLGFEGFLAHSDLRSAPDMLLSIGRRKGYQDHSKPRIRTAIFLYQNRNRFADPIGVRF